MIWLVAEQRPLLFIGIPGFLLVISGLFWGILLFQYYNQAGIFLLSYAMIAGGLLMLGAIAILMALMLNTIPHIIRRTIEEKESRSGVNHIRQ